MSRGVPEEGIDRILRELDPSDSDPDDPPTDDSECIDDTDADSHYVPSEASSSFGWNTPSDDESDIPTPRVPAPTSSNAPESVTSNTWGEVNESRNVFEPNFTDGVSAELIGELTGKDSVDFFLHFFDEEVLNLIVTETNRFAHQPKNIRRVHKKTTNVPNKPRNPKWVDVSQDEVKQFLGIVLWMGLVQMPTLRSYWSRDSIYLNNIPKVMTRNRFEGILANLHFTDNTAHTESRSRIFKIESLIKLLRDRFKSSFTPGANVCVDESNVPFRGRVVFRQYLPNKTHKYGIKLFKLCSGGYTFDFIVYSGKGTVILNPGENYSENIVMELTHPLLNAGRTVYTDNWYTSVQLAKMLKRKCTYLVGTLNRRRRNNPSEVTQKKLKKGEVIARQNEDNIVVLKWHDKRDVLMLSSKHDATMVSKTIRGKEIIKPQLVEDYNKGKAFIDLSDQMASYSPFLHRTSKWYIRLFFHLATATCVVNALNLYKMINKKDIDINSFKGEIIKSLIACKPMRGTLSTNAASPAVVLPGTSSGRATPDTPVTSTPPSASFSLPRQGQHELEEVLGSKRITRRRCTECYKKLALERNTAYARNRARKVNTICKLCNIPICVECFARHSKKRTQ